MFLDGFAEKLTDSYRAYGITGHGPEPLAKVGPAASIKSAQWTSRDNYEKALSNCTHYRKIQTDKLPAPEAPALIRGRAGRGGCDGLDNLRRQPETYVFRHHFQFPHVVKSHVAQKRHGLFDEALRR